MPGILDILMPGVGGPTGAGTPGINPNSPPIPYGGGQPPPPQFNSLLSLLPLLFGGNKNTTNAILQQTQQGQTRSDNLQQQHFLNQQALAQQARQDELLKLQKKTSESQLKTDELTRQDLQESRDSRKGKQLERDLEMAIRGGTDMAGLSPELREFVANKPGYFEAIRKRVESESETERRAKELAYYQTENERLGLVDKKQSRAEDAISSIILGRIHRGAEDPLKGINPKMVEAAGGIDAVEKILADARKAIEIDGLNVANARAELTLNRARTRQLEAQANKLDADAEVLRNPIEQPEVNPLDLLPNTQQTDALKIAAFVRELNYLKSMSSDVLGVDGIGPIDGRVGKLAARTGWTTENQALFWQTLENLTNERLRDLSGGAVTESEEPRIRAALPTGNEISRDIFDAKIDNVIQIVLSKSEVYDQGDGSISEEIRRRAGMSDDPAEAPTPQSIERYFRDALEMGKVDELRQDLEGRKERGEDVPTAKLLEEWLGRQAPVMSAPQTPVMSAAHARTPGNQSSIMGAPPGMPGGSPMGPSPPGNQPPPMDPSHGNPPVAPPQESNTLGSLASGDQQGVKEVLSRISYNPKFAEQFTTSLSQSAGKVLNSETVRAAAQFLQSGMDDPRVFLQEAHLRIAESDFMEAIQFLLKAFTPPTPSPQPNPMVGASAGGRGGVGGQSGPQGGQN